MLCASEGLTFGLRPNALGLRSSLYFIRSRARVNRSVRGIAGLRLYRVFRGHFPCRTMQAMQLVLQKVLSASVDVGGERVASIGPGYLVLLGVAAGDGDDACDWLAKKVVSLRLFPGEGGKINDRTVLDVGGAVLVVSQFTLLGSVEGSNRPDYTAAGPRDEAERLYLRFAERVRQEGVTDVQTGRFGASMAVASVNDGPVTLLLRR